MLVLENGDDPSGNDVNDGAETETRKEHIKCVIKGTEYIKDLTIQGSVLPVMREGTVSGKYWTSSFRLRIVILADIMAAVLTVA